MELKRLKGLNHSDLQLVSNPVDQLDEKIEINNLWIITCELIKILSLSN